MAFDFNQLEPEIQGAAYELFYAASRSGLFPRLTSGRRTFTQQFRLWRNYLRGRAPFPALPPGLSAHEYGIAFDMVVVPFEALEDVGATWQEWGGVWGGARDPVHYEVPNAHEYILERVSVDALTTAVDFGIAFLPGLGIATTAAGILQLFPRWAHSAVLGAMSSPTETIVEAVRRQ